MVSSVLQTHLVVESHTAAHLSEILTASFDERGLTDKHITGNTDNAKNIINAWKLMDKTTIGCIGHTLNLAARKALEINSVSQVVGRVKRLVSHFHYSTQSSNLLMAKQALLKLPKRKLIQDVDTRWNSTFDMIQSVLEQQLPISAVLMEGPSKLKDMSLESKQIGLLESLVEVLMPLKEIAIQLSGSSYCTISIIAPTMHQLIHRHYQEDPNDTKFVADVKKAICKDLRSRYQEATVNQFLLISSVCDPRFCGISFIAPERKCQIYNEFKNEMCRLSDGLQPDSAIPPFIDIKKEIIKKENTGDEFPMINESDLVGNLPSTSDQMVNEETSQTPSLPVNNCQDEPLRKKKRAMLDLGDIIGSGTEDPEDETLVVKAGNEFDRYLHHPIDPKMLKDETFVPLKWWKSNDGVDPLVSNVARKYLCVTATSTPSERIFSAAGNILTKKRAMLGHDLLDKLIFLNVNFKK